MPLTSETNLWLPVALLLTGRIYLLGFAWSWLMPSQSDKAGRWIVHAVQPLIFGIPVFLTIRMLSGELVPLPEILPELVAVLGLVGGLLLRREKLLERIKPCAIGFMIASMGSTAIMHLPNRSEWVVGGWDPGIYVNEGVNLARVGSYHHQADPFFSQLSEEELKLFTRIRLEYLEAHPVVTLDPETRSIKRFFFPLTSTVIAEYAKAGGIRAATRVNYFLALFGAMAFMAMLTAVRVPLRYTLLTTLCLILQPAWLYHLNIPTSEHLQLFFVVALGMLIPHLRTHPTALFGFGHILLCAGLNRFGFLPFGTLLCVVLALHDLGKVSPMNAIKLRLVQLVPCWMAAGHCAFHNATTLDRLGELTLMIFAAGLAFSMAALAIDFIGQRNVVGKKIRACYDLRLVLPITAIGLLGFVLLAKMNLANVPLIARGMLNYLSWPLLLLAAIGLVIYFLGKPKMDEHLFPFVTFLACATVLVLLQSEIAPLMPWASRRLIMYTIPLVAILAGLTLQLSGRAHVVVPFVLIAAAAFLTAKPARDAVNVQEFVGVSAQLNAVSDQIGKDDIVVADHFLWSTPLRMMYGKNVINGEVLWQEDTSDAHHLPREERFTGAMAVLRRLQSEGKNIRFLSSSDKQLEVYPGTIAASEDWRGEAFTYSLLKHHGKATGFKLDGRRKQFTLYTLSTP